MKEYNLGKYIKQRRKIINLTQVDVAKRVGVSGSQISKWENQQTSPEPDEFKKLCVALEISPQDLIEGNLEAGLIKENKNTFYDKFSRNAKFMIIGLVLILVGTVAVCFYKFDFVANAKEETFYIKEVSDGIVEVRKVAESDDMNVWADVVLTYENGTIKDLEVLELIFKDEVELIDSAFGQGKQNDDMYLYIYYNKEGIMCCSSIYFPKCIR